MTRFAAQVMPAVAGTGERDTAFAVEHAAIGHGERMGGGCVRGKECSTQFGRPGVAERV